MDEATSALDSESESAIQDALANTRHHATRFIITHRMATIQQADWLLVMDKGALVQQGTERQLRNQEGIYRSLLDGQFLLNINQSTGIKKMSVQQVTPKKHSFPKASYQNKKRLVKARGFWRSFLSHLTLSERD